MTEDRNHASLSPAESIVVPKFRELLDNIATVFHRIDSLEARPRTSLSGDDAATPREMLSHQFVSALIHASDALNSIKIMVNDGNSIPVFSAFSLARNAFESIGMAFWLLGPADRDTRVLRSLQLSWEAHKDVGKLLAAYQRKEYSAPTADDTTRLRFEEIRDSRPGNSGKSLNAPTISERMKDVERFVNPGQTDGVTLFALWNLTSGFAHGRRETVYHLLEKEVTKEWDTGFTAKLSTGITTLYPLCGIAHNYILKAVSLFDSRNVARTASILRP